MDNCLLILITILFYANIIQADGDLQKLSATQGYLDPLNDPDNNNTSIKDQEKRTILNPVIHNYAWAKHVVIRPSGTKQVIGLAPVDLKYTPVLRPVGLHHHGYHYNRPKIHFHIKRPVIQTPWKPIVPVAKPVLPISPVVPTPVVAKPIQHVPVPAGGHVNHVHLNPVPHIDHVYKKPHLHVPAFPVPATPVHTDHVHQHVVPHVDHIHTVTHVDHVHAIPQPVAIRPAIPVQTVFEVTKPDLGVLPLGTVFSSPVLKEVPAPQFKPLIPQPVSIPAVTPVHPVPQIPVRYLPEPPLHSISHLHQESHLHPEPHVHPIQHVHQEPHLHSVAPLLPDTHLHTIPHLHTEPHRPVFQESLAPHTHPVTHLHPLTHSDPVSHLHPIPAPHGYSVPAPHVHPAPEYPIPHLHSVPTPHVHPIPEYPNTHIHSAPLQPVVSQTALPPGVSVEYHGNTNFVNLVKDQVPAAPLPDFPTPALQPVHPPPVLPHEFNFRYPQIPQNLQPNEQDIQEPIRDGTYQPVINNQINFQQNLPQPSQDFPPNDELKYQLAGQVSSQHYFQGQNSIDQLANQGYVYQKPDQFIQPGQTDVQLPLHLPQHPGFQNTQRQGEQYEDSSFEEEPSNDDRFTETIFKPSIQLEPPHKK